MKQWYHVWLEGHDRTIGEDVLAATPESAASHYVEDYVSQQYHHVMMVENGLYEPIVVLVDNNLGKALRFVCEWKLSVVVIAKPG